MAMHGPRRLYVYLRQSGRKNFTPRQRRRDNKKSKREIYNYQLSCGHKVKNCDCPF